MTNIIEVLQERGFIDAMTSEEDLKRLTNSPSRIYCGFDPTADSLHLGNFVPIMGLAWFQKFGHTPVAIIGGATGMIGDPSGKAAQRQLLDETTIKINLEGIRKNLEVILDFNHPTSKAIILNNYEWYKDFSYVHFLRDVGSLFRVGTMLGKESVRLRMQSEEGMSYTEFSYQILQGYDFLHLFKHHGVSIQLGGSDQWGNITAGTDLIRRVEGKSAFGITFPLLTKKDGQKFGKSEKGAIWLSPEKLSPYEFYQYLVRVEDEDVIQLMRMLTFMDMHEIRNYEKMLKDNTCPPRTAQKRLAEEVTKIVHGNEGFQKALKVTQSISPGSETELDVSTLESIASDMPSCQLTKDQVINKNIIDLIVELGLQPSKKKAREVMKDGSVYLNNKKIEDQTLLIQENLLIDGRLILLSIGKKNKLLLNVNG
ncbi:MAG: tyrosine--tRNA ligase [Parachlamydiaceae bacterium]|nr:tyrosine--tRNA ligase [Parachlamydiaceae bacterium]